MRFISLYTHEPTGLPPTPQLMADMGKLIQEGMQAGWLLATEGVQGGSNGIKVRSDAGTITVTDGPFTEAKEVIGGYALIAANSKDEAIELTRKFLKVAGDGQCELHQLFEMPASANR